MKSDRRAEGITTGLSGSRKEISRPDKKAVLAHMTDRLPDTPWADIEILDWLPEDDGLPVCYGFADTSWGQVLVAGTPKGVCYVGLAEGEPEELLKDLDYRFGHTLRMQKETPGQEQVLRFLEGKMDGHVIFHLRGTPYQTGIWRKLIRIPYGKVISYSTLGGSKRHSRAAGTANGRNPVFMIVPCHRAVSSDGEFDRYFWGREVKIRLLAQEFGNSEGRESV